MKSCTLPDWQAAEDKKQNSVASLVHVILVLFFICIIIYPMLREIECVELLSIHYQSTLIIECWEQAILFKKSQSIGHSRITFSLFLNLSHPFI